MRKALWIIFALVANLFAYDANITVTGTVKMAECRYIDTVNKQYSSWAEGCPARSKAEAYSFLLSIGRFVETLPPCELPSNYPQENFPEIPAGYTLVSEEIISETSSPYPAYDGKSEAYTKAVILSGGCYGLSAWINYRVDVHGGFIDTKQVKRTYAVGECAEPDTEYPELEPFEDVLFSWTQGDEDRTQECSDQEGEVQSRLQNCQQEYRCVKTTCSLPDILLSIDLTKEEVTSSWSPDDTDAAQKREACNTDIYSNVRSGRTSCVDTEYCVSKLCREPDFEFPSLADNQSPALFWTEEDDQSAKCSEMKGKIQQERHECVSSYRCVVEELDDECNSANQGVPINSYVVPNNGVFHEEIVIDGTAIELHYSSRNAFEGNSDNANAVAPGWTLSSVHFYKDGMLYGGDGSKKAVLSTYLKEENRHLVHAGNGITYIFDEAGKELYSQETFSKRIIQTVAYLADDRIDSVTDRHGNTLRVQYDTDGKPEALVAPEGQGTSLVLSASGDIESVTYADGSSYAFIYDERSLMTEEIDPNGNRFLHRFNEEGKIVEVVDAENGIWSFDTLANTDVTQSSMTLAEGDRTVFSSYPLINDVLRSTVSYPNGDETVITTSPDRSSKTIERCDVHTVRTYGTDPVTENDTVASQTITMPSGLEKSTSYDTSYAYDENSSVTAKTVLVNTNGNAWTSEEDFTAHTKEMRSPQGRTAHIEYDRNTGLVQSIVQSGLEAVSYAYDDKGRVTQSSFGDRTTTYSYDERGNLASQTDPAGKTIRYGYDLRDRVSEITYPDGNSVYFRFDANGNMLRLTTPTPADFDFAYNGVDKRISMTSPLGNGTQYLYDKQRRLIQTIRQSGNTVENSYINGELVNTSTPERSYDFQYGCGGKLLSVVANDDERIEYSYDGDLVTQMSYEGMLNAAITYSYDTDFMVNSISYASKQEALAYDDDGLLVRSGGAEIGRNNANGLPETISDGIYSQALTHNGYGETGSSFVEVAGEKVFGYSVDERNANGQITMKTEYTGKKKQTYSYDYDEMGRLVSVHQGDKLMEAYTYDANGNRIHKEGYGLVPHPGKHLGAQVEKNQGQGHYHLEEFQVKKVSIDSSYTVEDQIELIGETNYVYDEDDYLSSKIAPNGTTHYSYGTLGELRSVVKPDGTIIEYLHNANNQRVAKKVDGIIAEKYLWKDLTTLLAVYDSDDNLVQRFEYAVGRMPYAMTYNGERFYLAYDQVGTLKTVSSDDGTILKSITYDTFGVILEDSNPDMKVPFGFAGGLYDSDTRLTRFGYRDYDAETGKWTAKDPIGFNGGDTNLYGYVLNDPVNFIDPEGKFGIAGAIGAGIIGGFFVGLIDEKINGGGVGTVAQDIAICTLAAPAMAVSGTGLLVGGLAEIIGINLQAITGMLGANSDQTKK